MFKYADYVYSVYKEKSFSKAASEMFISQPSLSYAVKKAEEEAGNQIFDRSKNPIGLTEFGAEYIRAIEQIQDIEDGLSELSTSENTRKRILRVAVNNLSLSYFVPQKISQFICSHPNIQLQIVESNTQSSLHRIDLGEVDLMITSRPMDSEKYEQIALDDEELILAVPKRFCVNNILSQNALTLKELQHHSSKHENAKKVSLQHFRNENFISLNSGNYLRRCTDQLFDEVHIKPRIILEVGQSALAYNFASLGAGFTIMANTLIEDSSKNESLYFYCIDSPLVYRKRFLCYRKNSYVTDAMQAFMEYMLM